MTNKSSSYPPYVRGEEGIQCPKCSYRMTQLRYCAGTSEVRTKADGKHETVYSCTHEVVGEHMHLVCKDCGYHQFRHIETKTK